VGPPVIDFHIHPIFYDKFYVESALNWIKNMHADKNWDQFYEAYADPEFFLGYLQDNGVDYAVIMADLCPAVTGVCTNEYVLDFCQGRAPLIPFASINPYLTVNTGRELQRLVGGGFRGVKLYPTYQHFFPSDRTLYPLYARAEELQVPLMVHTGSSVFKGAKLKYGDPLYMDEVAVDFPGLQIILVHSGRGFWYERAFLLARLHENVYMEVAGLPPQKLLDYFPELERVADKVLFGSDWPGIVDLKGNIDAIRRLPLTGEAKDKILGGNAARLLSLPVT
jgi:predicted TIM-barrel fold metal-dependent hydrolase